MKDDFKHLRIRMEQMAGLDAGAIPVEQSLDGPPVGPVGPEPLRQEADIEGQARRDRRPYFA
jgi:hypothetical protein